ncbi:DUF2225 domain-containing protein [Desulforamulus ferrireducens]|uniref:DUF2225 domain-containing protein n=1 Tax=Desulforamulus ferrireducens TaxID=1833852 RepID=A0A1S6IYA9_9FIRM|nr:DUF2225 domain-containing protein [Desulforamulus ferrireducens]AQS59741.1 hypothetical protein B0537_12035 [Desulforamulus ferrireducens]
MQISEDMLFYSKATCPNCGCEFQHPEVRTKYISIEKQDSDFCSYYTGINPIFYDVLICKDCGYAYTKDSSAPLSDAERLAIKTIMSTWRTEGHRYGGLRTLEQAIRLYNLAILCQELRDAKDSVKASLYLRLAWLNRYQGQQENEMKFLQRALEFSKRAFERESFSELKKELRMMYLIGELSFRTGDYKEAVKWFQAVTQHPDADRYPVFSRMARSRWQDARQEYKENS